jgi:radical S-adenosyl methionine domain-containing protein 2
MNRKIPSLTTHTRELVINWHVTEACNYRCRYCYAKWQSEEMGRELIHDSGATGALLEEIHRFFSPNCLENPLRRQMGWDSLRLNLAGGEPLLYGDNAAEVLKLARGIGFETSVISNGSRLTPVLMAKLAPHLSMLGLSLDSGDAGTNLGIGRVDRNEHVLSLDALSECIALGRALNPHLRLKINTVVNALNCREDMRCLILSLLPEKWKVLRMLPMLTDDLAVSPAEFQAFVRRHHVLRHVMRAEDNGEMAESYLMIDPHGRFFQNALGRKGYDYSAPILDFGADAAFSQIGLSARKFCARYEGYGMAA